MFFGRNGLLTSWPFPDEGLVLVGEGEADAAATLSVGHAATVGTPCSTPGRKVVETLQMLLAGREVVLAPDLDPAGDGWPVGGD